MKLKHLALNALMALCASTVMAGEYHYGSSTYSKEAACEQAERRAKMAARSKKTCYELCDVRACEKDKDGQFVCQASSANHGGSCGRSDKIRWDE